MRFLTAAIILLFCTASHTALGATFGANPNAQGTRSYFIFTLGVSDGFDRVEIAQLVEWDTIGGSLQASGELRGILYPDFELDTISIDLNSFTLDGLTVPASTPAEPLRDCPARC